MRDLYVAYNGAMPTTAALAPVTTGTAIKTMLQLSTPSTRPIRIVEWGVSMDSVPSAVKWELIQTDVAATVTAHVSAGVMPYNDPNAPASLLTLGTTATGYTASGEGSTATTRIFDYQLLTTNTYVKQWPLGNEPQLPVSKFLRLRATAAVAVNAVCYVVWAEA